MSATNMQEKDMIKTRKPSKRRLSVRLATERGYVFISQEAIETVADITVRCDRVFAMKRGESLSAWSKLRELARKDATHFSDKALNWLGFNTVAMAA